ncbi:MAG: lysine 2,3-aminomutase [Proteobacteria bacterium]|nr:lysine 2,3-aminomutase [Pseudomonadota bacterium]
MNDQQKIASKRYQPYNNKNISKIQALEGLPSSYKEEIDVVSRVLPFRTNNYVVDELIDWDNIPNDPIFQLTFPQRKMLKWRDYEMIRTQIQQGASENEIIKKAQMIQKKMNPHPAGQISMNVPEFRGKRLNGIQHKYDETVLFFPTQGQTCHAYCTYCFRWPQFVGLEELKFSSASINELILYLDSHPEVTDVLITGGDPLFMSANVLEKYIEPLIRKRPGNISTIRFGTKVPAYWPYRFLTDNDSDKLIRLFGKIVDSGFHLSIMSHFSHYRELETDPARHAIRRILSTGAVVRCQAPLIRHINDHSYIWTRMWKNQVALGAIPYYMFVERNTGPKDYFSVSLADAYMIFKNAYKRVSGLSRTVRGPSMSSTPGKILIDGVTTIGNEKVFVLKFIQGRDSSWVNKIFFAKYDEHSGWLDDLKPAFGAKQFFFEDRLAEMKAEKELFEDAS